MWIVQSVWVFRSDEEVKQTKTQEAQEQLGANLNMYFKRLQVGFVSRCKNYYCEAKMSVMSKQ